MTEITKISLENEMDIVVVHKRIITIGEYLRFTLTTQTAFSTAIAEVSREVIDRTNTGNLIVSVTNTDGKYFLCGKIFFTGETDLRASDAGMSYARKLVPQFDFFKDENGGWIELQIGIPRSAGLNLATEKKMRDFFKEIPAATPYEALKVKNIELINLNAEQDQELKYTRQLDVMKTEFISVASHELKTPLTTLKAYAELALQLGKNNCSDQLYTYIQKINTQSTKLQTLIQQLLDISKVESGKMDYQKEAVGLKPYLLGIIDTFSVLYPLHKIVLQHENINVQVFIDKLRLEQVFANLLGNAAKYAPNGKNIIIGFEVREDGMNRIQVKDEGIGMNDHEIAHVFDKFYRAEGVIEKFNGMGMGLYITRNIIEGHGGNIWVESQPGEGSSFYFTIPAFVSA